MGPLVRCRFGPTMLALFPIVLTLGLAGCGGRPVPVVLVSIDTLRPDHLGCYGYARPTSPNLDAFRKDAILFTNAFAHAPSTLASHAAILTSLIPPHHGGSIANDFTVSGDVVTLAEAMREAGYSTASFNGGVQLDASYGLDQGFDIYVSAKSRDSGAESLVDETDRFGHEVEQARTWIETQRGRAFFLFLHTYEVHHPYTPEERDLLERSIRAHEAADVEAMAEMLREDVRIAMPPLPFWFNDKQTFVPGLGPGLRDPGEWRLVEIRANRMPALATYLRPWDESEFRPFKIDVMRVEDGLVAEITSFDAQLFPLFGLPETPPPR